MNLKEKLQKYRGIDLKIVAYSALPIYWAMLLVSTFLHWNWRWHWGTKFAFHPTRLASTWSIQRIPLSLLLAPRTVGLCACTLVIRSLSLLTLAWSLNPCALVGMLVAWSLRACKLATLLPELSVILWMMESVGHVLYTPGSGAYAWRFRIYVKAALGSFLKFLFVCLSLMFTVTHVRCRPVPALSTAAATVALFRGRACPASLAGDCRSPRPEFNWSLVNHVWAHSNN
jgi:hypothetical protein